MKKKNDRQHFPSQPRVIERNCKSRWEGSSKKRHATELAERESCFDAFFLSLVMCLSSEDGMNVFRWDGWMDGFGWHLCKFPWISFSCSLCIHPSVPICRPGRDDWKAWGSWCFFCGLSRFWMISSFSRFRRLGRIRFSLIFLVYLGRTALETENFRTEGRRGCGIFFSEIICPDEGGEWHLSKLYLFESLFTSQGYTKEKKNTQTPWINK